MKKENRYRAIVLVTITILVISYMALGTSQTTTPVSSAEQQKDVADLKKQIAGLQERVNWLEERLTEPQRQKASQF
jgi:hypothetical protein